MTPMTLSSVNLFPLLIFLFACLIVAFLIRKRTPRGNFEREYFIGGRRLGPFVLVMTTLATFGSITAFVGMPGQAWDYGFGWVYLSCAQIVSLILLFGVIGKKLALISRRIHAVSLIDIINARFRSNVLTLVLSCALVIFFTALIVAQLVGAAKILEAATGYWYSLWLIVLTATTAVYTAIGGFRGVAVTDTLSGLAMIASAIALAGGILYLGGGYENIMQTISIERPEMLDIFAGGDMSIGLFITQWLILGLLVFAMPQVAVRCISFKNTRSLRHALWIGTLMVGLLFVGLTAMGALSYGVFPDTLNEYGSNIDDVIPLMIAQVFPPWLVDIVILGPIAAAVSTVSSLLISSSVNIIQGIYANTTLHRHKPIQRSRVRIVSQAASIFLSFIALVVAITPPDLIWRLSMFVFGGIEVSACWIVLFGLFWRRANKVGAVMSLVSGLVVYLALSPVDIPLLGDFGEVVIALLVSLFFMVGGSLFFHTKHDPVIDEVFFPEYAPSTTAAIYEYEQGSFSSVADAPYNRRERQRSHLTKQ